MSPLRQRLCALAAAAIVGFTAWPGGHAWAQSAAPATPAPPGAGRSGLEADIAPLLAEARAALASPGGRAQLWLIDGRWVYMDIWRNVADAAYSRSLTQRTPPNAPICTVHDTIAGPQAHCEHGGDPQAIALFEALRGLKPEAVPKAVQARGLTIQAIEVAKTP